MVVRVELFHSTGLVHLELPRVLHDYICRLLLLINYFGLQPFLEVWRITQIFIMFS